MIVNAVQSNPRKMTALMRPAGRAALLLVVALALPEAARAMEVVSPRTGAVLRGGTVATIAWDSRTLPVNAEEWEAFLSLDGGRYYAFRLTPHLDIRLRTFAFLVPNVATSQARILLRAGDEKREAAYPAPGTFEIVHDPNLRLEPHESLDDAEPESAREGDQPVLEWAEGSRQGEGLRHRLRNPPPRGGLSGTHADRSVHEEGEEPSPAVTPGSDGSATAQPLLVSPPQVVPSVERSVDLLLLCRRRNI
jgi:hypothetical protein